LLLMVVMLLAGVGPVRAQEAPPDAPAPADYEPYIAAAAREFGVDPALIRAIIGKESGGNASLVGPSGQQGLMGLMPGTSAAFGVQDPLDPAQNVRGGTQFLRSLLDRYGGDVRLAVAAFTAGTASVDRHGAVPPIAEVGEYVEGILAAVAAQTPPGEEATPSDEQVAAPPPEEALPARDAAVLQKCANTLYAAGLSEADDLFAPWLELCYVTEAAGGTFTVRPAH
jgi:hypothetical protein